MRTPSEFGIKVTVRGGNILTASLGLNDVYVLGSTIPLIIPRNQPVALFSFPLPEDKTPILIFFGRASKSVDSGAFLKIEYGEEGWWTSVDELQPFPYEMFVAENTITVKLSRGLVSTARMNEASQVSHDMMCRFLNGNITEDELFAEEILWRRLSGLEDVPRLLLEVISKELVTLSKKQ